MLRPRVIPLLLLDDGSLVKSVRFRKLDYIGDPINAIRIFNELEVDELILLDIKASTEGRPIDLELIQRIASECFMPLAYGGGVRSVSDAANLFRIGVEKISLNHHALERPALIGEIAGRFGSQAVVVSMDVKQGLWGDYRVARQRGAKKTDLAPRDWARRAEELGAGEILVTSVDRDGTWMGYDLDLVRAIVDATALPVIAAGGAGSVADIGRVVREAGASAAAAGSMVVYQKKGMGVLINFPPAEELERVLRASG